MESTLKERLENLTSLPFEEHFRLHNDLLRFEPQFYRPWFRFAPCQINVLLVVDGLTFGTGTFGLSNFTTIFKKMQDASPTNLKYNLTLAHRHNIQLNTPDMQGTNAFIFNRINNFRFDNIQHFDTKKYDQVWLFGIDNTYSLSTTELKAIDIYMESGGGLFATGDHGNLGISLCGNITRVKDMRHWSDTNANQDLNEVSMTFRRRNDTNNPPSGNASSLNFNDQSDVLPQNIHPRMYGPVNNLLPHPILAIKTDIEPSGIIKIMPDHPHEGECKSERDFTVTRQSDNTNHTIRTQNIAISFVVAGNRSGSKDPTDAHCFPSIGVWDGRVANLGRIVIDSTWHHFVNVNLVGFVQNPQIYSIIEQYYMNISRWMSRSKNMLCFIRRYTFEAFFNVKVMEASMNNANLKFSEIPLSELYNIGNHVLDIVSEHTNKAYAQSLFLEYLELISKELANELNPWILKGNAESNSPANQWLNTEGFLAIAIGSAVINIRDRFKKFKELDKWFEVKEIESEVDNIYKEGFVRGLTLAANSLQNKVSKFTNNFTFLK